LHDIAVKQIQTNSPDLTKLIQRLVAANVHKITSSTQITFNQSTGLFSTPLGIVTMEGIQEARSLLDTISLNLTKRGPDFIRAVNLYLRIIPQALGMKLDINVLFTDLKAIQQQTDILDSLEASFAALQRQTPTSTVQGEPEKVFSVKLHLVTDKAEILRINKKYQSTRKDMHVCSHLKIKNVYTIEIEGMAKAFQTKGVALGNVHELWHGTKKANVLSILKSGLQVSPPSTARIAGKMFGNGVYFAPASTKSLNYAYGYWDGSRDNNCFMFLASVAVGKSYVPSSPSDGPFPRRGFDSVWAKAGRSGVQNDEVIVYRNEQCNLTHLVEFDA
jgi:poly [ADP-ribose] polymerase